MPRLCSAANLQDAYLLLHALEHAGVAARVLNEHAHGALGELPFTQAYPEIWIDDETLLARGQAIVRAYRQSPDAGEPRRCPACGEENPASFELCWRCSQALRDAR